MEHQEIKPRILYSPSTGVAGHPADSSQLLDTNQMKSEGGVQSNGPSHPEVDPPPPPPPSVPDNNSNGCSQVSVPNHDRNGSLELLLEHKATPAVAQDRPAKMCRTEAEPLGQSELDPSRTHED